jgi:UDP-2,4-diacetamido-2,4,6-trideoxy-beta-L-altropyranose hydrolase
MNIVFRVDASLHMGSGHVMRCLTLANELARRGADCSFVCKAHAGHLANMIEAALFNVTLLPVETELPLSSASDYKSWLGGSQDDDARKSLRHFSEKKANWVVVDHYALDREWETVVTRPHQDIFVIDDLANRPHVCAALLDQSLGSHIRDYAHFVPPECRTYFGPEFALLRPEFAQHREASAARRQCPELRKLTISLGGVDPENITAKILRGLKNHPLVQNLEIEVIMGATAPWLNEINKIALEWPRPIEVAVNVTDMAERLSKTDLVIGAAGTSTWERACLGVPTILVILADNQRNIAHQMLSRSAVIAAIEHVNLSYELAPAVMRAIDTNLLKKAATESAQITDGLGVQRIAEQMLKEFSP